MATTRCRPLVSIKILCTFSSVRRVTGTPDMENIWVITFQTVNIWGSCMHLRAVQNYIIFLKYCHQDKLDITQPPTPWFVLLKLWCRHIHRWSNKFQQLWSTLIPEHTSSLRCHHCHHLPCRTKWNSTSQSQTARNQLFPSLSFLFMSLTLCIHTSLLPDYAARVVNRIHACGQKSLSLHVNHWSR